MRALLFIILAVGLAGCTPPAEEEAADTDAADTDTAGENPPDAAPEPTPTGSPAPSSFDNTAWRSRAENGAIFATYLDSGGSYRELRNGDPYQTGSWTYVEDGQLCLTPEADDAQGGCWTPGRMNQDGELALTNDADKRILVTRISYEPPADEEEEAAGE